MAPNDVKCMGCRHVITNKEFLTCFACSSKYDLLCSNIGQKKFNLMDKEQKRCWKCPECRSHQPKTDNSNTPIRNASAISNATALEESLGESLTNGVFPDEWKRAKIIPIHKKGDASDVGNYRPISILSSFSKLFESLLQPILSRFVDKALSDHQHGFRNGRSTHTNLASFITEVAMNVDSAKQTDVIYTDFSSAFDKVSHPRLLLKLKSHGVDGALLRWFDSYLTSRPQQVAVEGYESKQYHAISGVPQGSHLGPTLFLIFVNDISTHIEHSKFSLFADDLKLYRTVGSPEDMSLLQQDINNIANWCDSNQMCLNVSKCHHIKITTKNKVFPSIYFINGIILSEVEEIRDLGVVVDRKLSFVSHIDGMVKRAAALLGFIKRATKGFRSITVRMILFNALVRSVLEYASIAWNPIYAIHSQRIENIQRAFTRHIAFISPGISHRTPYAHRLSFFHMQSLRERRAMHDLSFLHGLLNGQLKSNALVGGVKLNVPFRLPRQPINKTFALPFFKTNVGQNAPLYRCCSKYNELNKKNDTGMDIFHDSLTKFKKNVLDLLASSE